MKWKVYRFSHGIDSHIYTHIWLCRFHIVLIYLLHLTFSFDLAVFCIFPKFFFNAHLALSTRDRFPHIFPYMAVSFNTYKFIYIFSRFASFYLAVSCSFPIIFFNAHLALSLSLFLSLYLCISLFLSLSLSFFRCHIYLSIYLYIALSLYMYRYSFLFSVCCKVHRASSSQFEILPF